MVIVVDDAAERRSTIGRALRQDGHEVIELADGAQLLARLMFLVALLGLRRESIAVVARPEPSVLAVLQLLRSAGWRIPVVLVADEVSEAAGQGLGAAAILCRPLDLNALRAVASRVVPPGSGDDRPGAASG